MLEEREGKTENGDDVEVVTIEEKKRTKELKIK
jgi:hypothetical protein